MVKKKVEPVNPEEILVLDLPYFYLGKHSFPTVKYEIKPLLLTFNYL